MRPCQQQSLCAYDVIFLLNGLEEGNYVQSSPLHLTVSLLVLSTRKAEGNLYRFNKYVGEVLKGIFSREFIFRLSKNVGSWWHNWEQLKNLLGTMSSHKQKICENLDKANVSRPSKTFPQKCPQHNRKLNLKDISSLLRDT